MDNKKGIVKALALLGFALLAVNAVFAFGNLGSTAFIQVFFVVIMFALVITSLQITKDAKESASVLGAAYLYFTQLIFRTFFFFIDSFVDYVQQLKLNNLNGKIRYNGLNAEEVNKLQDKVAKLNERINKDTFGEAMDIIFIIVAVFVAVVAIIAIVQLIMKKDFSKTVLGKITCAITDVAASKKEGKTVETKETIVEDNAAATNSEAKATVETKENETPIDEKEE